MASREIEPLEATPGTTGPGIVVKIANPREREIAIARRAEIYTAELGHHGLDEYDRGAVHLVALDEGGEMLGACRLLGPQPLPTELEGFVQLGSLLPCGGYSMQAGGLWVLKHKVDLKRRIFVALALWRRALSLAAKTGATALVVRTLPRLSPYYRSVGFQSLSQALFHDPTWETATLMFRPIGEAHRSRGGSVRYREQAVEPALAS